MVYKLWMRRNMLIPLPILTSIGPFRALSKAEANYNANDKRPIFGSRFIQG